jgi:hypothetical protein
MGDLWIRGQTQNLSKESGKKVENGIWPSRFNY